MSLTFYRDSEYLELFCRHFVAPTDVLRIPWIDTELLFVQIRKRIVRLLSTPTNRYCFNGDQCPAFASPEKAREYLRVLTHHAPHADAYIISPVQLASPSFLHLMHALHEEKYPFRVSPAFTNPVTHLSRLTFSQHFLTHTERKWHHLKKKGARLVVRNHVDRATLQRIFATEERSWKGRTGSALTIDTQGGSFFSDLVHFVSRRNTLSLFSLETDTGDVFAFVFGIQNAPTLYLVKTGYDESYKKYSPGIVLTWLVIEWMKEHDFQTLDFFGPAMDWHRHFNPRLEAYGALTVGKRSLRSRAYLLYCSLRPLIRKTWALFASPR